MKSTLVKTKRWWQATEKPGSAEWLIVAGLILVTYSIFLYTDMMITLEDSVQFWDGGLRGFYQYNLEHGLAFTYPPVYEVPIYIVFAVWNLPLWLLNRFTGFVYIYSPYALLWAKLMLVVFTAACGWLVYRICGSLQMERGRAGWAAFAFFTSMALIVPTFVTAQYDVVELLFLLLGVKAFVEGKEKRFLAWFAVAATLKTFALVVLIPLVLLREKRLLHAGAKIATGFIGLGICKLIYWKDAAYHASTALRSEQVFGWLLKGSFDFGLSTAALFVAAFGAVCIWCWVKKPQPEALPYYGIWIPALSFCLVFGLCFFNPYWIVLYAPFMAILAFATPRHTKPLLLLEALGEGAVHLVFAERFYSLYGVEQMRTLLLPHLFPALDTPRYAYLIQLLGEKFSGYVPALFAVYLCCHAAILVLARPGQQGGEAQRVERSVMWARAAVPALFTALLLMVFFIQTPRVLVNGEALISGVAEVNLLEGGTISQPLVFEEDTKLASIGVIYTGSGEDSWEGGDYVELRLTEAESGRELYYGYMGVNELTWDYWNHYTLSVKVKAGVEYRLELTGFYHKAEFVSVKLADDDTLAGAEGTGSEGSLALYITAK